MEDAVAAHYDRAWRAFQLSLVYTPCVVRARAVPAPQPYDIRCARASRHLHATCRVVFDHTRDTSALVCPSNASCRAWTGGTLWLRVPAGDSPEHWLRVSHRDAPIHTSDAGSELVLYLGLAWQSLFAGSAESIAQRVPLPAAQIASARAQAAYDPEHTTAPAPVPFLHPGEGHVLLLLVDTEWRLWERALDTPDAWPLDPDTGAPCAAAGSTAAVDAHAWQPIPDVYDVHTTRAAVHMRAIGDVHLDGAAARISWSTTERLRACLERVWLTHTRAQCAAFTRYMSHDLAQLERYLARHGDGAVCAGGWPAPHVLAVLRANALHFALTCSDAHAALLRCAPSPLARAYHEHVERGVARLAPADVQYVPGTENPAGLLYAPWYHEWGAAAAAAGAAPAAGGGTLDSIYACAACHSRNNRVVERQTRSADEGMTLFTLCMHCGKMARVTHE